MLSFNPLANIALGDISSDFSLHAGPPKPLLEILIHFGTARVNGKLRTMSFLQNKPSEVMIFRHHNTLPKNITP